MNMNFGTNGEAAKLNLLKINIFDTSFAATILRLLFSSSKRTIIMYGTRDKEKRSSNKKRNEKKEDSNHKTQHKEIKGRNDGSLSVSMLSSRVSLCSIHSGKHAVQNPQRVPREMNVPFLQNTLYPHYYTTTSAKFWKFLDMMCELIINLYYGCYTPLWICVCVSPCIGDSLWYCVRDASLSAKCLRGEEEKEKGGCGA